MNNDFDISVFQAAIGAILAIIFLYLIKNFSTKIKNECLGIGLVVASAIYVLFALLELNLNWFLVETSGLLIFLTVSLIGLKKYPLFLALGWLFHVFWDVGLHSSHTTPFVPNWYPAFCIGFDLIIASYLIFLIFHLKFLSSSDQDL